MKKLKKIISDKGRAVHHKIKTKIKTNKYLIALVTFLILYAIYSYITGGIFRDLITYDTTALKQFILSFGVFSYFILIFLVVIEIIFAPIPGLALYALSASLFGPFIGAILSLIGNTLGATICFYIARGIGQNYAERQIKARHLQKFDKYTTRYGAYVLFFIRINPFTSSDMFSYIAGLTHMRYAKFIAGTILGLIPLIFFQAYFADYLLGNGLFKLFILVFTLIYFIIFIFGIYELYHTYKTRE